MKVAPVILVGSRDEDILRRIRAVRPQARVLEIRDAQELAQQIRAHEVSALIVDSRCDPLYQQVDEYAETYPGVPVILLGSRRSDRLLAVNYVPLFARMEFDASAEAWADILDLAARHRQMALELAMLKQSRSAPSAIPSAPVPADEARPKGAVIAQLVGASRHFGDLDMMLDRAIEGLASALHTTRVGLFAFDDRAGQFRLRAGLGYLRATQDMAYAPDDPLVRWLEQQAHMITRNFVVRMQDAPEGAYLSRSLDAAGAELIIPLLARGTLLGWLFVGCRTTGQAYSIHDLEEFSVVADHLAMLVDNALLYREVSVQKTLAETLLHALPTGIFSVDASGVIRWFSTAAERITNTSADVVVGQPIEKLGPRWADAVRRAMSGTREPVVQSWEEPALQRFLRLEARSLGASSEGMGAIGMVQDLTTMRQLQEKQAQMERAAFWTDLAAGLSHEIRNPLVTIRTFAQLLPERYEDDEFREQFSQLVAPEVDRLNDIIEQINDFAHPPDPVFSRLDVRDTLHQAVSKLFPDGPAPVQIVSHVDGSIPLVIGDERALVDCFYHLFQNAVEALADRPNGQISYRVEASNTDSEDATVHVVICDNGRGVPESDVDKLFSPFYTTKARGMGLGLPIAKRTVIDHNGKLRIDRSGPGISVMIDLPGASPESVGASV